MRAESVRRSVERRREFLKSVACVSGLTLVGCATTHTNRKAKQETSQAHGDAEVTPGEDLMQEHGVLERILLIYEEGDRRIKQGVELDVTSVATAAGIIRSFIQNYHEKLEEQFVFPRLEKAQRELELIAVLQRQHQRGRELTDEVMRLAGASTASAELARLLRLFASMYRPHAAREDTVLFPAFRSVVGRDGYRELGEQFEEKEHQLFGEHGFQRVVAQVASIERALGIHDLASFTPP